jgi:hypothetical protein
VLPIVVMVWGLNTSSLPTELLIDQRGVMNRYYIATGLVGTIVGLSRLIYYTAVSV